MRVGCWPGPRGRFRFGGESEALVRREDHWWVSELKGGKATEGAVQGPCGGGRERLLVREVAIEGKWKRAYRFYS
jgi:hypothetical protein